MGSDAALGMFSELLWTALLVCGPLLGLTLLVGVLISIFQAVTQIQDMSLSFIPKMVAAVAALVMFGPWMLRRLLFFATNLISNIPNYF